MRNVKQVLRLKFELGLENRQIARSCLIPHSSVANYLSRAKAAGLDWPLPEELDDEALEQRLFPGKPPRQSATLPLPDFAAIHEELRSHRHVTLQLLWQEYKQTCPQGYQYSHFCALYAEWARKLDVVLRQDYRAGEKLFVDHAGKTIPVVDRETGQCSEAWLFVAVLGASNYTYAEATSSRDLAAWIGSHTRMVEFFGGVTTLVIPDNWKSGVSRACYYEPDLNPAYRDWAEHYGTVVMPARKRKPRDKAKVESGVLITERWILAALRKHMFFSVTEANQAIAPLLERLNQRRFRKLETSRAQLFQQIDRPALKPLPPEPFTFRTWKKVRVHFDYHVEIDGHYYSVPYHYVHEQLEARIGERTIEILRYGRRVACHVRSFARGRHTTLDEHRPPRHQNLQWTSERMIERGRAMGEATMAVLDQIMKSRPHPELGYRSCLGVLRLAERYSRERLEAACHRALVLKACSYRSIKSILATGLDRQPMQQAPLSIAHTALHPNVRGASYYGDKEVM